MSSDDLTALVIALGFIVIGLAIGLYQAKRRRDMLAYQAGKRNGEVVKGGLLGRAILNLPFNGNTVQIYTIPGSRYSPPRTFARMRAETANLPVIEILRNNISQKILGAFGRERALTDDEDFDKRCLVRCDDTFVLQRVLTPEVRQKFTDRSLRSMQLKVNPQTAEITISAIPSNDEAYDNFIDTALLIFRKLL